MPNERPSLIQQAPAWLWLTAAVLLAVPLLEAAAGAPSPAVSVLLQAGHTALEGVLGLWAARRLDLPSRARLALKIPGYTCLFTAGEQVALAIGLVTGWFTVPTGVDTAVTLASFLSTLGLLLLPMAGITRREWRTVGLDTLVSVGGLGALSWVIITQPLHAAAAGAAPPLLLAYGLAQVSHVAVLNLLVLHGLGVPSRRAIWLLVMAEATYLPVLWLAQYQEAGLLRSTLAIDIFYYGGEIPRLFSALAFRRDTRREPPRRLLAAFSSINPFLLFTPLAIGTALVVALHWGPAAQVRPLIYLLVGAVALLVVRLLVSAREHARLLAAEADAAVRLQQAKQAAVGRLAGGVAHEFNNLMQIVIGHADLAAMDAGAWSPVQSDLASIRAAAERAAALTGQLLHFSGRQPGSRRPIDLAATIRQLDAIRNALGPQVPLELSLAPVPLTLADPSQVQQALLELAANAREAMPHGGRFRIEVREDVLTEPLASPVLRVPPGRYVVIDASDTGPGIPSAALPHVFEPFFTTRSGTRGPGLGLAAVYGIVAAHRGGIDLDTAPGAGTHVRLYFPVVDSPQPA